MSGNQGAYRNSVFLRVFHRCVDGIDAVLHACLLLRLFIRRAYLYGFARHLLRYQRFTEMPVSYQLAIWQFHESWPGDFVPRTERDVEITAHLSRLYRAKRADDVH